MPLEIVGSLDRWWMTSPRSLPMLPRRVLPIALEWMRDEPVLLLEGPRSVGKSTPLRAIASATDGILVDLDDPGVRDAVTADPALFVSGDRTVCIDEYQKAPVVLDAIKAELNKRTTPGRFVLAGSARHDALPPAAQALTGRLSRLHVFPFSQGELVGEDENFLDVIIENPAAVVTATPSTTTRSGYIDRVVRGEARLVPCHLRNRRGAWLGRCAPHRPPIPHVSTSVEAFRGPH